MDHTRRSDTAIIQTFREHNIPAWIQRCLDSVRNWSDMHGHDYFLAGDEFYQLCGPEYLSRGKKNPQAITNLARLVATRQRLDAGYSKVIWMDADTFVFDPENLIFDFPEDQIKTAMLSAGNHGSLPPHRAKRKSILPPSITRQPSLRPPPSTSIC